MCTQAHKCATHKKNRKYVSPKESQKNFCLKLTVIQTLRFGLLKRTLKKATEPSSGKFMKMLPCIFKHPEECSERQVETAQKILSWFGVFQFHKLSEAQSAQCIIMTIVQAFYFQEKSLSGNAHNKK